MVPRTVRISVCENTFLVELKSVTVFESSCLWEHCSVETMVCGEEKTLQEYQMGLFTCENVGLWGYQSVGTLVCRDTSL